MVDYKNPKLIIDTTQLEPDEVTWKSPSNLALIKYWGKYGMQLPKNPSISFTLNNAYSSTTIAYKAKESGDQDISLDFFFNEEPNEAFGNRIKKYLTSLVDIFPFLRQMHLTIHSQNSFPHSAGIASSASGMSAIALCLCSIEDRLFGTLDDDDEFDRKTSFVARLGSGSACRSIFPKMAIWGEMGEVQGSSDYYAIPFGDEIHESFQGFHDDILIVSSGEKSVSSSAGHGLMNENPFADPRYNQARQRLHHLLMALRNGDMETFGRITENEALTLHALMMASNPSYILMKPNSLAIIDKIRAYRADTGHPVYFSLDAGPNIHVLYPDSVMYEVRPFVESELLPLCQEQQWLPDWVGDGPEEL